MSDDFALKMMKKLGWQEGKGLGKDEDGRVRPVQVDQKQNAKGIGFGTEGAFAPWWDDLYNKTASEIKTSKNVKKSSSSQNTKKSKKDRLQKNDKLKKDKSEKKNRSKVKVSKQ